tara:strand:- start:1167 stop:1523 length:357 start_codon:yes stop_codon:yes gene_type:complete
MNKTKKSLFERFIETHRAHPEIYAEFKKYTLVMKEREFSHYSPNGIMHIVRFHTSKSMRPQELWKCNNDFACCYARMFSFEFPEHADFFRLRVSKSLGDEEWKLKNLIHARDTSGVGS